MDGDPTPALTGRRRTRPTSIGCRNPWQPKPGRALLIAAHAAVQTNRATSPGHSAMLSLLPRTTKWRARAGVPMWSRLLACALLLLPAQALAGAREKLAALAPSGLVLVMDDKGNELVVQNADKPFVPASVAKIVTAWLAMEVLGANYRFETRF